MTNISLIYCMMTGEKGAYSWTKKRKTIQTQV